MDFSVIWAINNLHGNPERHHQTLQQAKLCEELGYDCVWFTEHHFEDYGRPGPDLMAAYTAAITSRIEIGIAVIVLPWHHPVDVAERMATLDHLTDGRFRFGIGRGNQPHEFRGYNVPLAEANERFEESFEIIKGLFTNDTFAYEGKYWQIPEIRLLPKPLQKPHMPIWQPAVSEASIRKIAAKGINGLIAPYLIPYPELKERYFDVWYQALADVGRSDLKLGHNEFVYVAETDEQAIEDVREAATWYPKRAAKLWSEADESKLPPDFAYMGTVLKMLDELTFEEIYEHRSLIGSPERVIEKLKYLEECGLQELLCFTCMGPQLTHEMAMKSIELFGKYVIPEFKKEKRPVEEPALAAGD